MMLLFSVSHLRTDVGWSVIVAFAGNAPLPFQQSLLFGTYLQYIL